MGPKLAARLASIGLLLVRDLLKHYPRDHVDYATRRRIEALEPGETATIVATIPVQWLRQPSQSNRPFLSCSTIPQAGSR